MIKPRGGRSSIEVVLTEKENPAGYGDGRSSTKVVLPENETPAPETALPVLKLYYHRMKIQPAAGDGPSSTKVVLPQNENPVARGRHSEAKSVENDRGTSQSNNTTGPNK